MNFDAIETIPFSNGNPNWTETRTTAPNFHNNFYKNSLVGGPREKIAQSQKLKMKDNRKIKQLLLSLFFLRDFFWQSSMMTKINFFFLSYIYFWVRNILQRNEYSNQKKGARCCKPKRKYHLIVFDQMSMQIFKLLPFS